MTTKTTTKTSKPVALKTAKDFNWKGAAGLTVGQVMATNRNLGLKQRDYAWIPTYSEPDLTKVEEAAHNHALHHAALKGLGDLGVTPETMSDALSYVKRASKQGTASTTVRRSFLVRLLGEETAMAIVETSFADLAEAPARKTSKANSKSQGGKSVDPGALANAVEKLMSKGLDMADAMETAMSLMA